MSRLLKDLLECVGKRQRYFLLSHFTFLILHSSLGAQNDLSVTLTPGSTNTLTLQTAAGSSDIYRIFESDPPFIGNQIDLRYPATFDIINVSSPEGWDFQNVTLNNAANEKIATYFFRGLDGSTPGESVDLSAPLHLRFLVEDLVGSYTNLSIHVEAQVHIFSTSLNLSTTGIFLQDLIAKPAISRLIAFRRDNNLALNGSDDIKDLSENGVSNLLYYAFGLGKVNQADIDRSRFPKATMEVNSRQFRYVRHRDAASDGIVYTVECSSDLTTWTSINLLPSTEQPTHSIVTHLDTFYEHVTLTFPQTGIGRFYRLMVSVD